MTPARARRRLDTDARRDEIVAAALDVLAHRDVGRVSVGNIADQAGSSPALIYHYFGSKIGLAETALGRTADELIERLDRVPDADIETFLNATLTAYLDFLQDHPASWAALLRGVGDPTLASIARRVDDHAADLALRKLGELGLSGPLVAMAVRGWLELVKGTCLRWLTSDQPSREVLHAFLANAFTGCVTAASEAGDDATMGA